MKWVSSLSFGCIQGETLGTLCTFSLLGTLGDVTASATLYTKVRFGTHSLYLCPAWNDKGDSGASGTAANLR